MGREGTTVVVNGGDCMAPPTYVQLLRIGKRMKRTNVITNKNERCSRGFQDPEEKSREE